MLFGLIYIKIVSSEEVLPSVSLGKGKKSLRFVFETASHLDFPPLKKKTTTFGFPVPQVLALYASADLRTLRLLWSQYGPEFRAFGFDSRPIRKVIRQKERKVREGREALDRKN